MSDVLEQLVHLLSPEKIEENLFRGQSQDLGWGTVFGGQVLGQALAAAASTVPDDRQVHSLHAYFLLPGQVDRPVVYQVDRLRDGRSFTTRRVRAIQEGHAICDVACSFQALEAGFEHQDPMPEWPGPDGLPSQEELVRALADRIPEPLRARYTADAPIEIRPIDPMNLLQPVPRPPASAAWLRAAGKLPDSPALHRELLTYASDFNLLATATFPHGVSWLTPGMHVASLDHAIWFLRPFRMDDWVLHVIESPSASGGRGLVRGRLFTRGGLLVAATAQEGLIRMRQKS